MNNNIVIINGSYVQMSGLCDRIYLIKLCNDNIPATIFELDKIAQGQIFTKIIAKVPSTSKELFLNNGYKIEAHIPGFYNNEIDVYFMGKFLTEDREFCLNKELIEDVLNKSLNKADTPQKCDLEGEFYFKKIEESEAAKLTHLYKEVFETYPFPIFNTEYIIEAMRTNNEYFGIWKDKELVATGSAEKDIEGQNAEVTDFAILPEYRGKTFSICLIKEIEKILRAQNFKTAYTIARAGSYGMNIAFARMKYIFAGTLINNTCISGNVEDMHVWYKKL